MGVATNGGIHAWYVSGDPQERIQRILESRGWQVTPAKSTEEVGWLLLSIRQDQLPKPDIILLGGSVVGRDGSYWKDLATLFLDNGIDAFVPFSSDSMINQSMLRDEDIPRTHFIEDLGPNPQTLILLNDPDVFNVLESSIRGARGPQKEAPRF